MQCGGCREMKYGHFDTEHDEYVIDRVDLPTSWTNYLGVENMCAVVNHTAGGYLFYKSPEYHRITRFRPNGVPMDRPGDYVYIRDDESGDFWSISWQPVGKPLDKAQYSARHGLSYSVYECDYSNIHASEKLCVPIGDDALIWDVNITNNDSATRKLSVFSYAEFSFHLVPIDNQNFQMSLYCAGSDYKDGAILYDLFYEEEGFQYFTSDFEPDGHDCVRDKFIGTYHTESDPEAVINGKCSGSTELGGNHCASLMKEITLEPGESVRLIYFLGEGKLAEADAIRNKYKDPAKLDAAYEELRAYWKAKQDNFIVKSQDPGVDTMINTWTLYQAEINVMFSRFASFIEVGGRTGLGYRDTAQDAMTVIDTDPVTCRRRIVELLQALTTQGYGIHLFEPKWFAPEDPGTPKKKPFKSPTVIPEPDDATKVHGIKDACADDALWLVPSIAEYVKETGDYAFLNEEFGYADGGSGTVIGHIMKIIDFSIKDVGDHGVCLGLRADWNDCLNLGGGESTLVTFLLYAAIMSFEELAANCFGAEENPPAGSEHELIIKKAVDYNEYAAQIRELTDSKLWDGDWFIRGITKTGRPIGTRQNKEGRIHLESNAWAVLSGAATKEKSERALESVYENLATPYGIMLNAPAYTKPDDDIGFVTRVYPGLKENGSVFSHPNPWVWAAECTLGNGDRAMEYYHSLCPYYQNDMIETRYAEPYSYCQFISGKDHTTYGRAHHPFMTGSGGWSYYAVTHYILGIRPGYDELIVDPCVPKEWKKYHVQRTFRGAVYGITVDNRSGDGSGVKKIMVNGVEMAKIPLGNAGDKFEVSVEI